MEMLNDQTAVSTMRVLRPGVTVELTEEGGGLRPFAPWAEAVEVRRTGEGELGPGDWVVVDRGDGHLEARLHEGDGRSAPFSHRASDQRAEVLARIVAVRRGERQLPLGRGAGALLAGVHRTLGWLRHNPVRRRAFAAVRALRYSRALGGLRRRQLGQLSLRPVVASDLAELRAFADRTIPAMREKLIELLRTRWEQGGIAVGAFDRHGKLRGIVYLDEYRHEGLEIEGHWARTLAVDPVARGLGLSNRLAGAVVRAAAARQVPVIYADVSVDNQAMIAGVLPKFGGGPAPDELTRRLNALYAARGDPGQGWRVYQFLPTEVVRRIEEQGGNY